MPLLHSPELGTRGQDRIGVEPGCKVKGSREALWLQSLRDSLLRIRTCGSVALLVLGLVGNSCGLVLFVLAAVLAIGARNTFLLVRPHVALGHPPPR